MVFADKDESGDFSKHLPALLRGYASQFPGRRVERPVPLYCGHMASPEDLEVYLWELAQSVGRCREMDELPEHVRDCAYCLTRLRDIAWSLRHTMTDSPLPLWGEEPAPNLMLRLEKVARWIVQEGKRVWAEVLVVREAIADHVNVKPGSWTVLSPVPVPKAAPTWRGATRSVDEPEAPSPEGERRETLGLSCQPYPNVLLTGEIVCLKGRTQARVRCLDPQSKQPCAGVFYIECSLDVAAPTRIEARAEGTAVVDLPDRFELAVIEVFREGERIGTFTLELEAGAPG